MRSLLFAAALVAAPASAQTNVPTDTPAPTQSATDAAISAGTAPTTAAANGTVSTDVAARETAVDAVNVVRDAQYDADMAAWLVARHVAAADQRQYVRQQRAYADAMAAWRIQVAACKRGNNRACDAPTPDPAAFY